ncbi:MAG TPA: flagellar basal body rod protein FlgB [Hyphomicrobiales bacterium]|nr:flagellar basal body rod protein FlgB [Hyphomicrobiales bacterium]
MPLTSTSLISMLKTRMHWQQAREKVLAEDVANTDTPGFRPRDLKPLQFEPNGGPGTVSRLLMTDPRHLQGSGDGSAIDGGGDQGPFPTTTQATGSTSLEDELLQVSSNTTDFQLVASLYSEGLGLIRSAAGGNE